MIKHFFSLILSTVILININAFSMNEADPPEDKRKAILRSVDAESFDDIYPYEIPLLTNSQFAAFVFFKVFIQCPVEMMNDLTTASIKCSIDSANNIRDFIEVMHFIYYPDSVIDELCSFKKDNINHE